MLDSIPENSRNIQNTTFPQNAKERHYKYVPTKRQHNQYIS
jgi:hypothetical protein